MINLSMTERVQFLNAESDLQFMKPWRVLERRSQHFEGLTVVGLADYRYLFLIEIILKKHPHVHTLNFTGNITNVRILNRLSSLIVRCPGLRTVNLVQTSNRQTLPLISILTWTEALRQINRPLNVTFLNCMESTQRVLLFRYYLQSLTNFELSSVNDTTYEIVRAANNRPPLSTFAFLTHLNTVLGFNESSLLELLKRIYDFQKDPKKIFGFCENLFIKMGFSIHPHGLLQLVARIEDHIGISLGKIHFHSHSGTSYTISEFAYKKMCHTPIDVLLENISQYSDDALQEFVFANNHGSEFWNITGDNIIELLILSIRAQSTPLIKGLMVYFKENYQELLAELSLGREGNKKGSFLTSYSFNPDEFQFPRQPDLNFRGLFVFLCYVHFDALDVYSRNKVDYIRIKKELPQFPLKEALEFIFSKINFQTIHIKWEGFLNVDWSTVDHLLIDRSTPKAIHIDAKIPMTIRTPLVDFLSETKNISKLSLSQKVNKQLSNAEAPNAFIMNVAIEVIRRSSMLKRIRLDQLFYRIPDLDRLGAVVAASKSLKGLTFESNLFKIDFYKKREESRTVWSGFFEKIIGSTRLSKLEIQPVMDLRDVYLQYTICHLIRESTSLQQIILNVENLFSIFVSQVIAAANFSILANHENLTYIYIQNVSTISEVEKGKITAMIVNNRRNKGVNIVVTCTK